MRHSIGNARFIFALDTCYASIFIILYFLVWGKNIISLKANEKPQFRRNLHLPPQSCLNSWQTLLFWHGRRWSSTIWNVFPQNVRTLWRKWWNGILIPIPQVMWFTIVFNFIYYLLQVAYFFSFPFILIRFLFLYAVFLIQLRQPSQQSFLPRIGTVHTVLKTTVYGLKTGPN